MKNINKKYSELIEYVSDRPGHDLRYAIDTSQTVNEIGWTPLTDLNDGLVETVKWYFEHKDWWQNILNIQYDGKRLGLNNKGIS